MNPTEFCSVFFTLLVTGGVKEITGYGGSYARGTAAQQGGAAGYGQAYPLGYNYASSGSGSSVAMVGFKSQQQPLHYSQQRQLPSQGGNTQPQGQPQQHAPQSSFIPSGYPPIRNGNFGLQPVHSAQPQSPINSVQQQQNQVPLGNMNTRNFGLSVSQAPHSRQNFQTGQLEKPVQPNGLAQIGPFAAPSAQQQTGGSAGMAVPMAASELIEQPVTPIFKPKARCECYIGTIAGNKPTSTDLMDLILPFGTSRTISAERTDTTCRDIENQCIQHCKIQQESCLPSGLRSTIPAHTPTISYGSYACKTLTAEETRRAAGIFYTINALYCKDEGFISRLDDMYCCVNLKHPFLEEETIRLFSPNCSENLSPERVSQNFDANTSTTTNVDIETPTTTISTWTLPQNWDTAEPEITFKTTVHGPTEAPIIVRLETSTRHANSSEFPGSSPLSPQQVGHQSELPSDTPKFPSNNLNGSLVPSFSPSFNTSTKSLNLGSPSAATSALSNRELETTPAPDQRLLESSTVLSVDISGTNNGDNPSQTTAQIFPSAPGSESEIMSESSTPLSTNINGGNPLGSETTTFSSTFFAPVTEPNNNGNPMETTVKAVPTAPGPDSEILPESSTFSNMDLNVNGGNPSNIEVTFSSIPFAPAIEPNTGGNFIETATTFSPVLPVANRNNGDNPTETGSTFGFISPVTDINNGAAAPQTVTPFSPTFFKTNNELSNGGNVGFSTSSLQSTNNLGSLDNGNQIPTAESTIQSSFNQAGVSATTTISANSENRETSTFNLLPSNNQDTAAGTANPLQTSGTSNNQDVGTDSSNQLPSNSGSMDIATTNSVSGMTVSVTDNGIPNSAATNGAINSIQGANIAVGSIMFPSVDLSMDSTTSTRGLFDSTANQPVAASNDQSTTLTAPDYTTGMSRATEPSASLGDPVTNAITNLDSTVEGFVETTSSIPWSEGSNMSDTKFPNNN